jgi:hypothetical protein
VDDEQVRLRGVGRLDLERDDLQLAPALVGSDVEPGVGAAAGGD